MCGYAVYDTLITTLCTCRVRYGKEELLSIRTLSLVTFHTAM